MSGTVELDPDRGDLVIRFPYDKLLVEEIKGGLPRRRWDPGAKCWRVPGKDVEKVYDLLLKHGFAFAAEVSSLLAGTTTTPEPPAAKTAEGGPPERGPKRRERQPRDETRSATLDPEGGHVLVRFPYDEELVAAVKELPDRRWDRKARTWRVSLECGEALRRFLTEHDFEIAPEVAERLAAGEEQQE